MRKEHNAQLVMGISASLEPPLPSAPLAAVKEPQTTGKDLWLYK